MIGRKLLCRLRYCNPLQISGRKASSRYAHLPLIPPEEVDLLSDLHDADKTEKKADIGVGVYRTDEGEHWVLPVVRKAELILANDKTLNKEYLPGTGLPAFTDAATKLLLTECHPAVKEGRTLGVQCLSGTGSLRIAAEVLRTLLCMKTYYVPKPTWGNHNGIFLSAGFENKKELTYWDQKKLTLNIENYLRDLERADENSVVIFHTCAHNPTGTDPTQECWKRIAEIVKQRKLFPVFDTAYHGFATGDLAADGWAVRYFVEQGIELIACQSFSKNFGLYAERVGNAVFVINDKAVLAKLRSQVVNIIRHMYSSPPAHGAHVVSTVLNNKDLLMEWELQLCVMTTRVKKMRCELRQHLERLKTPGTWNYITDQVGMFAYCQLSKAQYENMVKKHHVYMTKDGRMCIAAMTPKNVELIAKAIDDTARLTK